MNKWNEHYQSNTLTNPWAVVIKSLDTVIAYWTMRAAGRSIQHAGITVFNFHRYSIDDYFLVSRQMWPRVLFIVDISTPIIMIWFWHWRIRITRHYARISSWGQYKGDQNLGICFKILGVKWWMRNTAVADFHNCIENNLHPALKFISRKK